MSHLHTLSESSSEFDFGGDDSDIGGIPPLEDGISEVSGSSVSHSSPPAAQPSHEELSDDDLTVTNVISAHPLRARTPGSSTSEPISIAAQLSLLPGASPSHAQSPAPTAQPLITARALPHYVFTPAGAPPAPFPVANQPSLDILASFPSPFASAPLNPETLNYLAENNFAPVFIVPPRSLATLAFSPILVAKQVVANVARGLQPFEGLYCLHKGYVVYPMVLSTTGTPRVSSNADDPIALSSDSDSDEDGPAASPRSAEQQAAVLDPLRYQRELSDESRRLLARAGAGADAASASSFPGASRASSNRSLPPGSPFYSPTGNVLWSLLPESRDRDLYLHARPPGPPPARLPQPRMYGTAPAEEDDLVVADVRLPPSPRERARQAAEALRSVGVTVPPANAPSSRRSRPRSRQGDSNAGAADDSASDSDSDDGRVTRPDAKRIRVDSSSVPPVQSSVATEQNNEAVIARLSESLTCPVCLGPVQDIVATKCGHIFCRECVRRAVALQKACPTCRNPLLLTDIHKLFF